MKRSGSCQTWTGGGSVVFVVVWPVRRFPVLVFAGVGPSRRRDPARRRVPGGADRTPCCGVFQAVVFGAGLAKGGDGGAAAVGPGQEVVGIVVQGMVVAAREAALGIAEP